MAEVCRCARRRGARADPLRRLAARSSVACPMGGFTAEKRRCAEGSRRRLVHGCRSGTSEVVNQPMDASILHAFDVEVQQ